ncbi:MAG: hypothetical protein ACKVTZ_17410, partial [Bacteroidia bacterium]
MQTLASNKKIIYICLIFNGKLVKYENKPLDLYFSTPFITYLHYVQEDYSLSSFACFVVTNASPNTHLGR